MLSTRSEEYYQIPKLEFVEPYPLLEKRTNLTLETMFRFLDGWIHIDNHLNGSLPTYCSLSQVSHLFHSRVWKLLTQLAFPPQTLHLDLKEFLPKTWNLQRLVLFHTSITDESLIFISVNISSITMLFLQGSEFITDAGIKRLHYLPKLRFVDLTHCPQITERGVNNLKEGNRLRSIEVPWTKPEFKALTLRLARDRTNVHFRMRSSGAHFGKLFKSYYDHRNTPENERNLKFFYGPREIMEWNTPYHLSMKDGSTIVCQEPAKIVDLKEESFTERLKDQMVIGDEHLIGLNLRLRMENETKRFILNSKEKFKVLDGIAKNGEEVKLRFNGTLLDREKTPEDYEMEDDELIDVFFNIFVEPGLSVEIRITAKEAVY